MIPTYVFGWPSGKETGDYLALDLGTSHLSLSIRSSHYLLHLGRDALSVADLSANLIQIDLQVVPISAFAW